VGHPFPPGVPPGRGAAGCRWGRGDPPGCFAPGSDEPPLFPQHPGHLPDAGGPGRGDASPQQALRRLGRVPGSLRVVGRGAQGKAEPPPRGDVPLRAAAPTPLSSSWWVGGRKAQSWGRGGPWEQRRSRTGDGRVLHRGWARAARVQGLLDK